MGETTRISEREPTKPESNNSKQHKPLRNVRLAFNLHKLQWQS